MARDDGRPASWSPSAACRRDACCTGSPQRERADAVSEQILAATIPLLQPRQLWFRLTSETDVVEEPNGQEVAGD